MSVDSVEISTFLENLKQVMKRLSHHYKPDRVRSWVTTGHPKLGWNMPMDFLENRMPEVLEIIDGMDRESKIVDPLNEILKGT